MSATARERFVEAMTACGGLHQAECNIEPCNCAAGAAIDAFADAECRVPRKKCCSGLASHVICNCHELKCRASLRKECGL